MEILEADPLTFLGRLLDRLDGHFVVAATHSYLMVGGSADDLLCI